MANGSFILDFLLEHKENVFFETDASIQKVLTYACALGNTNGGTIVLGVKDSGETIGLPEAYSDEVVKQLNEKILPALASRVKASKGDYYDIFLGALEHAAKTAGIDPFTICSEQELLSKVLKVYDPASGNIPRSFIRTLPSIQLR